MLPKQGSSSGGPVYTLSIEKIVSDGFGLGHRADGKAVLVPFVLPGERVEVQPLSETAGFVSARLIRVMESSPDRRNPVCPHFGVCGGCDFQHAVYSAQLRIKTGILEEYIRHSLPAVRAGILEVVSSPAEWGCRNTAVFHRRKGRIGFFESASDRIVEPALCPVLAEGILGKRLEMVSARGEGDAEFKIRKDTSGRIVSSVDKEKNNLFIFGELHLRVWIRNFFQSHTALIPAWLGKIRDLSGLRPGDELLDLYSGVGIISLSLASAAARVTGIEADRAAVKRAIINAGLNRIERTYFFAGPVERLLPRVERADFVIMNPPRGGADMSALSPHWERLRPRRIVYSSCHPSTLFRDLSVLERSGYRVRKLVLLDMFPQTRHFEVLAGLERA